eukprot:373485-Pelagomonas_calceolata.AAC.4
MGVVPVAAVVAEDTRLANPEGPGLLVALEGRRWRRHEGWRGEIGGAGGCSAAGRVAWGAKAAHAASAAAALQSRTWSVKG